MSGVIQVLEQFTPLIVEESCKYADNSILDVEDYIQEARVALLQSLSDWTPDSGLPLFSFTERAIKDAIINLHDSSRQ